MEMHHLEEPDYTLSDGMPEMKGEEENAFEPSTYEFSDWQGCTLTTVRQPLPEHKNIVLLKKY